MVYWHVLLRLFLTTLFSGIIGFEREKFGSNAGLRTHVLVGVGSTTIALIQIALIFFTKELYTTGVVDISLTSSIRTATARLISQVVSGIGFLGAGTIIVTKRNVSGLTTAASIWNVAAVGLAIGLGFYTIGIFSFILTSLTLVLLKKLSVSIKKEMILIKYVKGELDTDMIADILTGLGYEIKNLKYSVSMLGSEYVFTNLVEIRNAKDFVFSDFVTKLSHINNVISVERTNLE